MESNNNVGEIRMAVLGDWMFPQLADVLALQRAEEPETPVVVVEQPDLEWKIEQSSSSRFDLALSAVDRTWLGWIGEPLWHDTLAIAVPKCSPLLAYREVPYEEVFKQPLVSWRAGAGDRWRKTLQRMFDGVPWHREQMVETFDMAMTLVAAGYGIAAAPAKRLSCHAARGIVSRPLAGVPDIVTAYLLRPNTLLADAQTRFIQRARSLS